MKKIHVLLAAVLLLFCFIQCTEDDVVEKSQYEKSVIYGGEEGDQELDSERD